MKCLEQAVFKYTWPGRKESFICVEHAEKLLAVANAIDLPLQLILLSGNEFIDKSCSQEVEDKQKV